MGSQVRPVKNNNPGDLRWDGSTNWQGMTGVDDKNFIVFDTVQNGARAAAITALNYHLRDGINTLREFGARWAPASDNGGDSSYGPKLAAQVGVGVDENYDFLSGLPSLLKAIFENEFFGNPILLQPQEITDAAQAGYQETGLA